MAQVTRKGAEIKTNIGALGKERREQRENIAWRVRRLRIGDLRMIEFIEDAIELSRMSFKTRKSRPELEF